MSVELGYPVTLVHPNRRAAVKAIGDQIGAPEQFPNVVVNSALQEAEHRLKGYLRFGEPQQQVLDHHEFPKFMRHPEHKDSWTERKDQVNADGRPVGSYIVREHPEVFPDMVVNNRQEEAKWREQDYKPAGEYDKPALESQLLGLPDEKVYEPQEYPRWEIETDEDGKQVLDPDGRPRLRLVERDPNVEHLEPTNEFPKRVGDNVIHDPRFPSVPDPNLYPMWVHKDGKPSDASELAKTPQEEFEIRRKWEAAKPKPEPKAEAKLPPSKTSDASTSVRSPTA